MGRMTLSASHIHTHGSSTCYVHCKCRCDDCRAGNTHRETTRTKQKAYGRWQSPYVDAAPIRAHVLELRAAGMGYKTIASRANVNNTAVRSLLYGREDYLPGGGHGPRHGEVKKRMSREVAAALLAVTPTLENLPSTAPVPARATVRRIQALIAFGWPQRTLAHELGVFDTNLSSIRLNYERAVARHRGSKAHVQAHTALAVAALYERLSAVPPPTTTHRQKISVSRARQIGRENGWPLPMDWEAYDNDFDRVQAPRRSAA